jgi:hypothetical protein
MLSALALAAGTLLVAAPASAAIVFSFAPSSTHIDVGENVTINATISGLGDEILSAYDLNFIYTASVLNWQIIVIHGGHLGNDLGVEDNGFPQGNLGFDNSSLDLDDDLAAVQPNSLTLFSFVLKGMTDGTTNFTLGNDPDFERNFVGRDALSLNVDVGSVCIGVGTGDCGQGPPIPEPASFGLAALGLLALGAAGRARRK